MPAFDPDEGLDPAPGFAPEPGLGEELGDGVVAICFTPAIGLELADDWERDWEDELAALATLSARSD